MKIDEKLEFESIEIRPVNNGFIITLHNDEGDDDFVFDSHHKTLRFVKARLQPEKEPKL